MKLYTEEQVIDFAMSMISQYEFGNKNIWNRELLKESLDCKTPIELPSDEEINEVAMVVYGFDKTSVKDVLEYKAFKRGAKWVRDKIQGGKQ